MCRVLSTLQKTGSKMKSMLREFAGKGLVYSLGSTLSGLAGFILIPFFVTHLKPAEYGRFALAEVEINLLLVFIGSGMHIALLSRYPYLKNDSERRCLVGSVFTFTLITVFIFESMYLFLLLTGFSLLPNLQKQMAILVVVVSSTEGIWLVFATLYRAQGSAWRFIFLSISKLVLSLVVTIILIVYMDFREEGILYGRLAGNLFLFLLLSPTIFYYYPHLNLKPALNLLKIGIPLVPAAFATMWVTMSPRIFIEWFGSSADVGIFVMSSKLSSVLTLFFVTPFGMAWMVALFRISQKIEAKTIYARILTYYCLVGGFLALSLGLASPYLALFLEGEEFALSPDIITIMALANVVSGLMYPVTIGPYVKEKTSTIVPIFIFSAAFVSFLGPIMTSSWGVLGAGYAVLIVYIFQGLFLFRLSNRIYTINIEIGRLCKTLFSLGMSYVLCKFFIDKGHFFFDFMIEISTFTVMLFFMLFLLSFFNEDEVSFIKGICCWKRYGKYFS